MKYVLDNNVKTYTKNNKIIFLNPNKGTFVKMRLKNKEILGDILQGNYNDKSCSEYIEKIINSLKSSYIINEYTESNKSYNEIYEPLNSVYFIVTEKCNLNCKFCCTNSGPLKNSQSDLSVSEISSTIDKISNLKPHRIIITGGEPFIRKDILDIVDMLSDGIGCKIIVQSNGLLLTNEIIDKLYKKVYQIDISLENIFENKNEKDTLIPILDYLKFKGIKIVFSFVAMPENLKYIKQFIDLCVLYEAEFTIKTVQLVGRANENKNLVLSKLQTVNMYYEVYKYICQEEYYKYSNVYSYVFPEIMPKITCSACGNAISITSNGDIYPCHSLRYPEFYLGNILNMNHIEIRDKLLQNKHSKFYNSCFNIDERKSCKECEFKYLCGGICFANAYKNKENKFPTECNTLKIAREFYMWEYDKKDTAKNNMERLIKRFNEKLNNETDIIFEDIN